MNIQIVTSEGYELLDCGDERKLERFGLFILDRPAPQAIWPKSREALWKKAHAAFQRHEDGQGDWRTPGMSAKTPWKIPFGELQFELRLTGFGNVGIFPEHSAHWKWMDSRIRANAAAPASVLNLFGYTGGASLICARAGARVTHVDAAKAVNAWAIGNAEANAQADGSVRCLAEDALKFAAREIRRKKKYDAIIVDPPSFGRGAAGEVWKIERDFHTLLLLCAQILSETPLFMLVTAHSPGVTPVSLENLMPVKTGTVESGEMLLMSPDRALPSGVFARWTP